MTNPYENIPQTVNLSPPQVTPGSSILGGTNAQQPGILNSGTNNKPSTTYDPAKVTATGYKGATYNPSTYQTTDMRREDVSRASAATAKSYKAKASNAQSVDAQAHTYNAYKQAVRENELTSHHLQKLLDENSDYVKRGRTEGKQYAQSRGILNTTMGAGAAHGAAIDRAAPIAMNDAGTYNQRALAHIDAENTARRTNATNKTNVSIRNADAATQVNIGNADRRTKVSISNADAKNRASIANANNQTATSQFNAGQENDLWKQYIQNKNDASKFNTASQNEASRFNADSENQANKFTAHNEYQANLVNAGADNEAARLAITENGTNYRFDAELDWKTQEAQLERVARDELERYRIDEATKTDINNAILQSFSQIQNNPDLTTEAKQQAMTNIVNGARTAAALSQELESYASGDISTGQLMQSNNPTPEDSRNSEMVQMQEERAQVDNIGDFFEWSRKWAHLGTSDEIEMLERGMDKLAGG